MVDFHSHILPGIDDGAEDVRASLKMLRESFSQGVRLICATPHFYADEDEPAGFLRRRGEAYGKVLEAAGGPEHIPEILLGAEVLYFPGISVAEEIRSMTIGDSPFLLIEPPMVPWSESMLEEIELCGRNLRCIPVIAHIDRYIRMLRDPRLFDRVRGRRMLVQANAGFFLHPDTSDRALVYLEEGRFQFIGSDCHDLRERRPNLGEAAEAIRGAGLGPILDRLNEKVYDVLKHGIAGT